MEEAKSKMSADEAQMFERFSEANAEMAVETLTEAGACDGTCQPYSDIYTLRRWNAQGFRVVKGAHGARLNVIVHRQKRDEVDPTKVAEVGRMCWHTTVFCRHQVQREAAR